jgi:hypothetical protein
MRLLGNCACEAIRSRWLLDRAPAARTSARHLARSVLRAGRWFLARVLAVLARAQEVLAAAVLLNMVVFGGLIVLTQSSASPLSPRTSPRQSADLFSPALDQIARSEAPPSRAVLQERCGLTDLALTANSKDLSTTDMAGLLMVEKELQMELESAPSGSWREILCGSRRAGGMHSCPTNCPLLSRAPRCLRPNA